MLRYHCDTAEDRMTLHNLGRRHVDLTWEKMLKVFLNWHGGMLLYHCECTSMEDHGSNVGRMIKVSKCLKLIQCYACIKVLMYV